jgi:hypothetical protein
MKGEVAMLDGTTLRVVCAVLAVCIGVVIFLRRRSRNAE